MPYTLSKAKEISGNKDYLHDEQGNVRKFETREEVQEFLDENDLLNELEEGLIQVEYEFTDRELSILFQFAKTGMADADCFDEIKEVLGVSDEEMIHVRERLHEHLENN